MNARTGHLTIIALCCLFYSCASIVPVSNEIIERVGGETELDKFQYYISRGIVMDRTENETDAGIVAGQAKIVSTTGQNQNQKINSRRSNTQQIPSEYRLIQSVRRIRSRRRQISAIRLLLRRRSICIVHTYRKREHSSLRHCPIPLLSGQYADCTESNRNRLRIRLQRHAVSADKTEEARYNREEQTYRQRPSNRTVKNT